MAIVVLTGHHILHIRESLSWVSFLILIFIISYTVLHSGSGWAANPSYQIKELLNTQLKHDDNVLPQAQDGTVYSTTLIAHVRDLYLRPQFQWMDFISLFPFFSYLYLSLQPTVSRWVPPWERGSPPGFLLLKKVFPCPQWFAVCCFGSVKWLSHQLSLILNKTSSILSPQTFSDSFTVGFSGEDVKRLWQTTWTTVEERWWQRR